IYQFHGLALIRELPRPLSKFKDNETKAKIGKLLVDLNKKGYIYVFNFENEYYCIPFSEMGFFVDQELKNFTPITKYPEAIQDLANKMQELVKRLEKHIKFQDLILDILAVPVTKSEIFEKLRKRNLAISLEQIDNFINAGFNIAVYDIQAVSLTSGDKYYYRRDYISRIEAHYNMLRLSLKDTTILKRKEIEEKLKLIRSIAENLHITLAPA
ncbi:MAG: hypothetical protein KKA19_01670, partial [Candidatus Margulisbacteria bacterium]|nr:hypothetical protein [Candidatus Margulisiibacteriota bacterium]